MTLHKAFSNTFVVQNTDNQRGKIEKKKSLEHGGGSPYELKT